MCDAHRVGDREAQFAGGLLLQRRSGERRSRVAHGGFLLDAVDFIGSVRARLQEFPGLFLVLETVRQLGKEVVLLSVLGEDKLCCHTVGATLHEVLDFFLAFDDEAHRYALHTACREGGLYLFPK